MGFEAIELPVESPGDWDPARAADLFLPSSRWLPMLSGRWVRVVTWCFGDG
jgi:hypothetical protein